MRTRWPSIRDTLIDVGNLYLESGQSDKALQVLKESLQIQRDANDESYQGICLNNIGNAYIQKGETECARRHRRDTTESRSGLRGSGAVRPRYGFLHARP